MKTNYLHNLTSTFILSACLVSCGQKNPQSATPQPDPTATPSDSMASASPATETIPETPSDATATGIDVSHFNGAVNWAEIKAAGIDFAYSKATQGVGFVDPRFAVNEAGSGKIGLHHGAYHFYIASDDPAKQAELFINTVKTQDNGTLPPVLDLEQGGVTGTINAKTFQTHVITWLKAVEKGLNVQPIIYTNTPFSNQYLNNPEFANYHLWIAEYGVPQPRIPKTWEKKGWLIWQRTDRDKIEGALSTFDEDTTSVGLGVLTTSPED